MTMSLKTQKLLGIPITISSKEEIVAFIEEKLATRRQTIIFTPNPEIMVEAKRDPAFASILSQADVNLPDGKGVALALGVPVVTGRDFMLTVLAIVAKQKGSVFILCGSHRVLAQTLVRAKEEHPHLHISGSVGPVVSKDGKPTAAQEKVLEKQILDELKNTKPTVILVGFGAPKQEKWIIEHSSLLPKSSFMAVGGSFDYYAREKALPPTWMGKLGLEWLWRLIHEKGHLSRVIRALLLFPILIVWTKRKK